MVGLLCKQEDILCGKIQPQGIFFVFTEINSIKKGGCKFGSMLYNEIDWIGQKARQRGMPDERTVL